MIKYLPMKGQNLTGYQPMTGQSMTKGKLLLLMYYVVGHDVDEVHVSVEKTCRLTPEEEPSSPSDVIHASYTEDPSVTLEEPGGDTAPAQCPHVDVEPLSAVQSRSWHRSKHKRQRRFYAF
jgi:hypothetical protein